MKSKDTKTSEELKADVLNDLRKVDTDFNRMRDRMTPGQIIDDAILSSDKKTPRAVFDLLKNNPIGTTFLGLGTILLKQDENQRTYESTLRERTRETIEKTRYQTSLLKGKVAKSREEWRGRISDIQHKFEDKRSSMRSIESLDPMIFISAGFGLGALSGFSMPIMDWEKNWTGDTTMDQMESLKDELSEAVDKSINLIKNEVFNRFSGDFKYFS